MWLIDTATYELKTHNGPEDVDYFILSHTWQDDEVSFDDMRDLQRARLKKGFAKIEAICDLARRASVEWAWVDTCCIDKSSSAELTESINSMFRWYKEASVCIVYLDDLKPRSPVKSMKKCKWFTRGWTLQEMIAPGSVDFYDQTWKLRGPKHELAGLLSNITGVNIEVLEDGENMFSLPVGRRMSWAADRVTTRLEDRAYSLLGIFDVNMPLIYGEGDKAFMRLQETIARETDDLSLLAWLAPNSEARFRGVFAQSPSEFRRCNHLIRLDNPLIQTPSFTVTNKGVQVDTLLGVGFQEEGTNNDYTLSLYCTTKAKLDHSIIIRLVKTPQGYVRHQAHSIHYRQQFYIPSQGLNSVNILKQLRPQDAGQIQRSLTHPVYFRIEDGPALKTRITPALPDFWDSVNNRYLSGGHASFVCLAELATHAGNEMHFGPDLSSMVVCGFLPARPSQLSEDHSALAIGSDLEPWAYLYNSKQDMDSFNTIHHAKNDSLVLTNLGRMIRTWLLSGQHRKLPPAKRVIDLGRSPFPNSEPFPPLETQISVETRQGNDGPEHTVVIKFRLDDQATSEPPAKRQRTAPKEDGIGESSA